ncbi:MAG: hypothetical protein EOR94_21455 [Mesorhizobium sp.]|nr:MAG: hypothetical protein EOR94_21455 [Mesorhizobium sp.]
MRLSQAPRLQLCADWVSPINSKTIEIDHPPGVSNLGQWDIGDGMGRSRGDITLPARTLGRLASASAIPKFPVRDENEPWLVAW